MARRIRAHDWSATPLGAIGHWPQSLRTAVDMVLAMPGPATVLWGPAHVQLYNDAYIAVARDRHPALLGRPVAEGWPDAYEVIAPLLDAARAGRATRLADFPVALRGPDGQLEERAFDTAWSSVRDEAGAVAGVLQTLAEVTDRHRVEAALRESEARYRALATAGTYLTYQMGPNWRQMRQLDGREFLADTPEPTEDWPDAYILPEDRPAVFAAIADAIRNKSLFELEHRVRRADGSVGWVLSRAVPMLGPEGEIVEWFGAGSDVTERRVARERLRESQAHLAAVFEALPMGVGVFDAHRALTLANQEMQRFMPTGVMPSRDAARRSRWRAWHPDGRPVEPQDFPGARALRGERVVPGVEMLYTDDDGREVWTSTSAVPLKDESRVAGAAVVVAGIDALKRGAEALAAEREQFHQFSDASTNVLWIRDAQTMRMTFASPAFDAIYGIPGPDRGGAGSLRSWVRLIEPESRRRVLANFRRIRAGERVEQEFRFRRASDGALRWIHNTDFPLRDAAGKVRWLAGIGADTTDAKEATGRQDVLVAELQHRTRNLLAVVRNVARRSIPSSPGRDEYDARLAALGRVQGFLSRSPLYTVPLADLVEAELAATGDGASDKVAVGGPAVDLPGEGVQVVALVLHELATNAVKYGALAQASGRLSVTWHVEASPDGSNGEDSGNRGDRLVLDWRESGVAMPDGPPARRGYGSELITRALPYQLKAETALEFAHDGVRCRIALPAGAFTDGREAHS